jgi:hypothetical protein
MFPRSIYFLHLNHKREFNQKAARVQYEDGLDVTGGRFLETHPAREARVVISYGGHPFLTEGAPP